MTTRNEAAERPKRGKRGVTQPENGHRGFCSVRGTVCTCGYQIEALAAAKTQSVERIRAALSAAIDANMLRWLAWDDVAAILDEEAAR